MQTISPTGTDSESAHYGLKVRSLRTNDSQGFLVHLLFKG